MSGPAYSPPYDSPLEDEFARVIVKYLRNSVDLQKQVRITTICGYFVIDFVIVRSRLRIGIECDGAEFHDISRDEWRDAMILGAEAVDVIYHFPGKALYYNLEDCLYVLSQFEPDVFTERGLISLERLATDAVRAESFTHLRDTTEIIGLHYPSGIGDPLTFTIFRRSLKDETAFWRDAFRFARASELDNLDAVIQLYREPPDNEA